MKPLFIFISLLAFHSSCFAGLIPLIPDMPTPRISLDEAATIARKRFKEEPPRCLLVGAQWCRLADFKLPVSDGSQPIMNGDMKSYSWFITYVIYDPDNPLGKKHPEYRDAKYNEVIVIRVEEDGKAEFLPSDRT